MPGNIGPLEVLIVLIVALVVFGPKRLPELGNGLGRGLREFKETVTGEKKDEDATEAIGEGPAGAEQSDAPTSSEVGRSEGG